jgi:hypothetical protein
MRRKIRVYPLGGYSGVTPATDIFAGTFEESVQ